MFLKASEVGISAPTRSRRIHFEIPRDRATLKYNYTIGKHERLAHVVSDQYSGKPVAQPHALKKLLHFDPGQGVERTERRVEGEKTRLAYKRPRQRDALLLTAGKHRPARVWNSSISRRHPHLLFAGWFGPSLYFLGPIPHHFAPGGARRTHSAGASALNSSRVYTASPFTPTRCFIELQITFPKSFVFSMNAATPSTFYRASSISVRLRRWLS